MVEKAEVPEGWPLIVGEYSVGDPTNCVAVITLGSHLGDFGLAAGAAIMGPGHTENIGVERVVANIVSNPNIRFFIVTGTEVKGHRIGDCLLNLHQNGVKENRVVGAKGAIPYLENLPEEAVERFQKQVEIIDLIGTEDEATITNAIKEAAAKDPGAYPEPPYIVEIATEEEEVGMMEKYAAGIYAGKIEGIMVGLVISLVLLGLLAGGI